MGKFPGCGAYQSNEEIMESGSSSNRILMVIYNKGIFYSTDLRVF